MTAAKMYDSCADIRFDNRSNSVSQIPSVYQRNDIIDGTDSQKSIGTCIFTLNYKPEFEICLNFWLCCIVLAGNFE